MAQNTKEKYAVQGVCIHVNGSKALTPKCEKFSNFSGLFYYYTETWGTVDDNCSTRHEDRQKETVALTNLTYRTTWEYF